METEIRVIYDVIVTACKMIFDPLDYFIDDSSSWPRVFKIIPEEFDCLHILVDAFDTKL